MHPLYLVYKATKTDMANVKKMMPHCEVQIIQSYYKHYLACSPTKKLSTGQDFKKSTFFLLKKDYREEFTTE